MDVELHLMDDRKVIKSVKVEGDLKGHFHSLLDTVISSLDEYPCGFHDVDQSMWKVIRAEVAAAKRIPEVTKDTILGFNTEVFSIVYHEVY